MADRTKSFLRFQLAGLPYLLPVNLAPAETSKDRMPKSQSNSCVKQSHAIRIVFASWHPN
jgi:hypothetical protein